MYYQLTLVSLLFVAFSCSSKKENHQVTIEAPSEVLVHVTQQKSKSGDNYRFIHLGNSELSFKTTKPEKDSTQVLLSVAAAFTDLTDFKIDGVYLTNGVAFQKARTNKTLGGGFLKTKEGISLIDTKKGALFTDSVLAIYKEQQAAVFQQILIIKNGVPETFSAKRNFQRRAVVTTKDDKIYIVENEKAVTLAQFCADLVELDSTVNNALYLDMGSWDEGWYRYSNDSIVTIGQNKSSTIHQSNWLVFEKE
ncbi:MAG: hypothetical protein ACI9EQ_001883 [Bacteroidia bacterium]|jgi:hypothetical protein